MAAVFNMLAAKQVMWKYMVMIHNSSVNSKLIHFLLWIKGSHQSPILQFFKCSGRNLLYSSCHFPNHKSIFLQILHHSSVSWKVTPLYFFSSKFIYFAQKEHIRVKLLRLLSTRANIHQNFIIFETTNQFSLNFALLFNVMKHKSFIFLAEILYIPNKKSLSKYKFTEISRE